MITTYYDDKTEENEENDKLHWSKPITNELMAKILLEQGGNNKFNISEFYKIKSSIVKNIVRGDLW